MILIGTETLTSLIHILSESLLTPVVILLVVSIILVILGLGGLINEFISRKPIDSGSLEDLMRRISFSTNVDEMKNEIKNSNLFDYQKEVLLRIANNYDIGFNARKALASELISAEETRLIKKTNKTDILVRVGPSLGLLGTLIPLGPGLAALGTGDIATLAQSLTIAFDTTVTGLTVGAIAFIISKYKKQWYEAELIDLETIAEAELETIGNWWFIMLRKRRRISDSVDDDPMSGLNNLSDAMLVLALGFLIFAIMALSVNPDMITQSQATKDVSTSDSFTQNYTDAGGMEDSGYSEVGKVYEDPATGKLVMVSG